MQNLYEKRKEEKIFLEKNLEEKEETINSIISINIDLLDEFNSHIFSKLPKNKFVELKDSIKRNGVLSPIIVRKKGERYEIISGHNRVNCCKELGVNEVPCIIKDYDDVVSELVMIETNLTQREDILLCEKGLAYKKQLELLKKINKENDLKTSDNKDVTRYAHNEYISSIEELSQNSEDSRASIQRLIRLTELIPDIQQKVNCREIPLLSGVELSYIKSEEQKIIYDYIVENKVQLTVPQAQRLREYSGELTEALIDDIIKGKKNKNKNIKFTGKIQKYVYKKYKDKFQNDKEFNKLIDELLEMYFSDSDIVDIKDV